MACFCFPGRSPFLVCGQLSRHGWSACGLVATVVGRARSGGGRAACERGILVQEAAPTACWSVLGSHHGVAGARPLTEEQRKRSSQKRLGFRVAQEILRRKRAVRGLGISSRDAPSGAPARCRCSRWHPVPSATTLVPTSEPPRSSFSSLAPTWSALPGRHVSRGPGGVSGHRGQLSLPGHPAGPGPPSQGGARRSGRRRTLAGLSGTAPVPPASASLVGCWRWSRRCPPILCSEPWIEAGGSCACPRDSCQSLRSPSIRAAPEAALSAQTPACQEAPSLGGSVPQTPRPAPASALWASVSAGGRCGHKELHLTSLRGLNAVPQGRAPCRAPPCRCSEAVAGTGQHRRW